MLPKSISKYFPSYFEALILLYPLIIRGMYWIRQAFDANYMNGVCLVDLVRLSAPEHYDVHPFWKYYTHNNETCESVTNKNIDTWFVDTHKGGRIELYFFYGFILARYGYGVYYIIQRLVKRQFVSFGAVLCYLVMAWCHSSFFHTHSHYQNDLTHLNGNVMHHSDFRVNGNNESLVGTLPPGLLYNFELNFLITSLLMVGFTKYFGLDSSMYYAIAMVFIPTKMIWNMKVIHPYIHTHNKSYYPWPINAIFRDYEGHVLCHHVSGLCLGDTPIICTPYDYFALAHAKLYQNGTLIFKSFNHYAFNVLVDYGLLILTSTLLFTTVFLVSRIMTRKFEAEPQSVKKTA